MYKKILIVGQAFNKTSGGGITLSNLFKGWPKEYLAVAAPGIGLVNCTFNICNNNYRLGKNEHKVLWPFIILQKQYASGKIEKINNENNSFQKPQRNSLSNKIRTKLVDCFFYTLHFLGIYHLLYRFTLSDELKLWIQEFDPDIIYSQLSSFELIRFIESVRQLTNKPIAIHIMDDWPRTISKPGILHGYWERKIENEFAELLNKTSMFFSISEGMSKEYLRRYNKCFIPFHNPIEIEKWLPFSKKDYNISDDCKILYTGRIGTANSESIYEACLAVDYLNKDNARNKIELHIYTSDYESKAAKRLTYLKGVKIFEPVPHNVMPELLSSFDLLFLPLDFTEKGIRFAKYSMPTKASEYMISGVPILLYCSTELSIYKHAVENNWAYVVSENNNERLCRGIDELLNNTDLREKLGNAAHEYAIKNYNANKIREQFKNLLNTRIK